MYFQTKVVAISRFDKFIVKVDFKNTYGINMFKYGTNQSSIGYFIFLNKLTYE
ncbi:hypothetical protein [Mycoplasma testudineum]|uniref:hypothetical protein n=1 Tax=Mycoplasma testudineum TaxID=244584 RepID=UPI001414F5C5|nr:hypothetical protein [Mycoplasma testudineum]